MGSSTEAFASSVVAANANGTWANLANAQGSTSGTFASWTAAAANLNGGVYLDSYGLDALVPAGATVTSLTVRVKHYVSDTTLISGASTGAYVGTTLVSNNPAIQRVTTTTNITTTTLTGVTRAQLANLRLRVNYAHNNSTTSAQAFVDWVGVVVNYTETIELASSMQASSTLSPNSVHETAGSAYLSTPSTLSAAVTKTVPIAAALAAPTSLQASPTLASALAADLSTTSTLTAGAGVTEDPNKPLAAVLQAASTLTAQLARTVVIPEAGAYLSTPAALQVDIALQASLGAALVSTSTLGATLGAVISPVGAQLQTSSTLSATVDVATEYGADLVTTSTLRVEVDLTAPLGATMSTTSTLGVAMGAQTSLGAALSTTSTLSAGAGLDVPLTAELQASSTLAAGIEVTHPLGAQLQATSTLSAGVLVATPLAATLQTTSTLGVSLDIAGAADLQVSLGVAAPWFASLPASPWRAGEPEVASWTGAPRVHWEAALGEGWTAGAPFID